MNNERDLRIFEIKLKHHLAVEQELFDAGLMEQPPVAQRIFEAAKAVPEVRVNVVPDFQINLGRKISNPVRVLRKHQSWEPQLTPEVAQAQVEPENEGSTTAQDFSINLQRGEPQGPQINVVRKLRSWIPVVKRLTR